MTLIIAHRGASAYAPENTMPAFELAARQGADMVELDVQRSSDGVVVVFHDDTTERWDRRRRRMTSCTFAELQALDIGGARIATLAEVCDFAREQNIRLNVELKEVGIGAEVAHILRETRADELTLISSFAPAALLEMREIAPEIPRGYLMGIRSVRPDVRLRESWPIRALRSVEAQAWHPTYRLPMVLRNIPRVRAAGYIVNVWTVNDPSVMRSLLALSVDGIITDTPDVLRKLIEEGRGVRSA